MNKQIFSLALGATLIIGYGHLSAYADSTSDTNVVNPDSDVYDTTRQIEDSIYDLTDSSAEKALLQNEYAEKRAEETELALQDGNVDLAQDLLTDSNESAEKAAEDLSNANESSEDVSDVTQTISDETSRRVSQLTILLNSENLPEQAKKGISNALYHQKQALKKASIALKKEEKNKTGDDAEADNQSSIEENNQEDNQVQSTQEESKKDNSNHVDKGNGKSNSVKQQGKSQKSNETKDSGQTSLGDDKKGENQDSSVENKDDEDNNLQVTDPNDNQDDEQSKAEKKGMLM